jgi:hypothetical protein
MIVDTEGTIVYKGPGNNRDLDQDISYLLKGEKLSGPGTHAFNTEV